MICLAWFACAFGYFGLSFLPSGDGQEDEEAVDIFTNGVFLALAELPAFVFSTLLLDRIGRRACLVLFLATGGFALCGMMFESLLPAFILVILSMVGKCGVAAGFCVVYVMTSELYPSEMRGSALGFCNFTSSV